MEKDAVAAHGASFTLQDRLHLSSDSVEFHICTLCKNSASVVTQRDGTYRCTKHSFAGNSIIHKVQAPQSFRVLMEELSSLHLNIEIETEVKK